MAQGGLNGAQGLVHASLLAKISIASVIGVVAGGGVWVGTIQNQVGNIKDDVSEHTERGNQHTETGRKLTELETKVEHLDEQLDDVEGKIDLILNELRQ